MSSGRNRYQVAVVGRAFGPEAEAIIRDVAPDELELHFDVRGENATALFAQSDFVLVTCPVTEELLQSAPKLKLVHKWGIGVDLIDLAAAARAGVYVAITAGQNAGPVSEHTVMLMLATMRRLPVADRSMRERKWIYTEMRAHCRKLGGKTVGILGFGNIGRAVAQRLLGFETTVIYYDPVRAPEAVEQATRAQPVSFDELIARSDVLTVHCPGKGPNTNLIDRSVFARMKRGAVLINAARGDIVNEDDLVDALASRQLMGAGLDAFEPEPPRPDSRLVDFDNVVLTPHTAGSVLDNVGPCATHAFRNMLLMAHGEPIPDADLVVRPATPRAFAA